MSKFKNLVDQLRQKRIEGVTSVDAVIEVVKPVVEEKKEEKKEEKPVVAEEKPKTTRKPRTRKGN